MGELRRHGLAMMLCIDNAIILVREFRFFICSFFYFYSSCFSSFPFFVFSIFIQNFSLLLVLFLFGSFSVCGFSLWIAILLMSYFPLSSPNPLHPSYNDTVIRVSPRNHEFQIYPKQILLFIESESSHRIRCYLISTCIDTRRRIVFIVCLAPKAIISFQWNPPSILPSFWIFVELTSNKT